MPAPECPSSKFAALTEKELEILRLLAAGHTVKSIAAGLGRSETSINERLRDARRKTGIGSSRELARLLDAQKIWDKNFGLPTHGSMPLDPVQPPTTGLSRSKGTIIMLIAMSVAAAGLVFGAAGPAHLAAPPQAVAVAATRQPPLAGSWALDVMRIPAEERPRRVTMTFRVSADQHWTTMVEIVAPDGTVSRAESTAALDGVPVPVSGNMAFIDTVSLRQPAPNTLVMTIGKDGAAVSTRVYTAGKDRKSMTETIVWAGNGIPKLETTHFKRIG